MIWFPETAISANISDSEYFETEPWKSYISNSKLGLLDPSHGGSMSLFEKSWKNERRSKSLQVGTIVHSLLLQSNNYGVSDILRPSGKLGDMVYDMFRLRTRDNPMTIKEAIDTVLKLHNYYNGKPSMAVLKKAMMGGYPYYKHLRIYKNNEFILNSEEVNIVLGCLEGLKANQKGMEVLFPKDKNIHAFNEFSVACAVEVANKKTYVLKAKIDNWTLDLRTNTVTLNDLKTTGTNIDNFVDGYWELIPTRTGVEKIFHPGSFQKYSYFRQLAMYAKILENYVINAYQIQPKMRLNILAVETKDPFRAELFDFGSYESGQFERNEIRFGESQLEDLLNRLAKNGYNQDIIRVDGLPSAFV